MKNRIFIILPVFNRLVFTKRCVQGIFKQSYKNFTLILIDDGSTDGTASFIENNYPKVKIIKGDGNWWWTKSMYMGVKKALKTAKPNDYILEMNNDLYFGPSYIGELINFAKKHPDSLVGSMCVRSQKPNEVVEAGVRIDWSTGLVYGVAQTVSQKLSYYKNMSYIKDIDALPGKGTLIPVKVFKKIGNFNYKKLPHYIADYEFACRAKRNGFDLIVDTKAVAKHYWEATGIYLKNESRISFKRAVDLMLGKKSMNNIVDWITFLFMTCPKKYLLRNLYYSFLKIVKAILSVFPFYYLRRPLRYVLTKYLQLKNLIYILYLKIRQFPEYHLK